MTLLVTSVVRGEIFAERARGPWAEMGDFLDTKQDIVVLTGKGLRVT